MTLLLRTADETDRNALDDLAALDSAAPLTGPVLLALADGTPVAALSLADHRVVADPFARTATAVSLLRRAADPPRERRALTARRLVARLAAG